MNWHAAPLSADDRSTYATHAEAAARSHPEFVDKVGWKIAVAMYYAAFVDKHRCGHLPYREFIECICSDEEDCG